MQKKWDGGVCIWKGGGGGGGRDQHVNDIGDTG